MRRKRFLIFLSLLLYLSSIILFVFERSFHRERDSLITKYRDFTKLTEEYKTIIASGVIERINRDKSAEGLLPLMNNLIDSFGLRNKVKSIRAIGDRQLKDLKEERVEIDLNKLTMNEMLNLLYRIENHPAFLSIKDIRLKKDFEHPERIDLNLKIALYRKVKV